MILLDSVVLAIWRCKEDYDRIDDFDHCRNCRSGVEVPLDVLELLFLFRLQKVEQFDSKDNTQLERILDYLHVVYAYPNDEVSAYQRQ